MIRLLRKRLFSSTTISKLDHLLSLPESPQKHSQILALIDMQGFQGLQIQSPSTISALSSTIIHSGSLKHIKLLHALYGKEITLDQLHQILNVCELEKDIEFGLNVFWNFHRSPSSMHHHQQQPEIRTLNRLLSIAMEKLQSEKTPFQPAGELALSFPSNFQASYLLLGKIVELFEQHSIPLNLDSIKMLIGHFVQMEDFEAAFRFVTAVFKDQNAIEMDTEKHNASENDDEKQILNIETEHNNISIQTQHNSIEFSDLVCYFVHVALQGTAQSNGINAHYRGNVEYCFKLLGFLQDKFPQLAIEMMIESFVKMNSLSFLKRLLLQQQTSIQAILQVVSLSEVVNCALKYRDYEFCLQLLLESKGSEVSVDVYANLFGSFVEFCPLSEKTSQQKEAELKEFIKKCQLVGLERRDSTSFVQGLTCACMKWDASILERLDLVD